MSILNVIILAIVEGLTEFLPISSTAHLLVVEKLLNTAPSVLFTVVVQIGPILASIFYFRKKIITILKNTFKNVKEKKFKEDFGIWILIGIIPVLIVGYLLSNLLDKIYAQPWIIVFTTIFFGFVFYLVELKYKKDKKKVTLKEVKVTNIFKIGLAQVLSIIPGVSRSGSTIAGGLVQGIDFADSIEISFLMSIPVMLAATLFELLKSIKLFTPSILLQLLVGVIVSYIAGFVSIKLTLGFLRKNGFFPILIYRLLFAVFIMLVLLR